MSKKLHELMQLTAAVAPNPEDTRGPLRPKTAPGQLGQLSKQRDEALDRAEAAEAKASELEDALRNAKSAGGSLDLPLDQLHEVKGRRRKLTDEEYQDLKNNLEHNALASPITVRARLEGGYEILSGHNRVQIYRELGRKTIQAWPMDASDEQAEDLAFFANALAARLPDYDKYRGYKRILDKHPELEQRDLARRVGISSSQLDRLLAFDALPPEAHALLRDKPQLIGANAAEKLAAVAKKKGGAKVTEAIEKLASGEIKLEAEAVMFASTETAEKKAAPQADIRDFKLGKSKYATLRQVNKTLRIDFATEEEARSLNEEIQKLIEQRLETLKTR